MKKVLLVLLLIGLLIGCSKKDELALGQYQERKYTNENFNLDLEVPEGFSYFNADELEKINEQAANESQNKEAAKYRNLVLHIEHLDGSKVIAFVDSKPESSKNKEAEANNYLDFLSSQDIDYKVEKSEVEINDTKYLKLDLDLPFDGKQINYITVQNNKLINIQISYKNENVENAQQLLDLYE